MKIKKFKYKYINSTNDIAINLIKKKNVRAGFVLTEKQKKEEVKEEKSGFHTEETYLFQFFSV